MTHRIYLASSWRNERQPEAVSQLRELGHKVYDFRNPEPGDNGFHWSEIDPQWRDWTPAEFRESLQHPVAESGFRKDFESMRWATAFVLLMPCGRSAHLEAGWAIGMGKPTAILLSDGEPELMYRMAGEVCTNIGEVAMYLAGEDHQCSQCGAAVDTIIGAYHSWRWLDVRWQHHCAGGHWITLHHQEAKYGPHPEFKPGVRIVDRVPPLPTEGEALREAKRAAAAWERSAEMACQSPPDGCDCPGCSLAEAAYATEGRDEG